MTTKNTNPTSTDHLGQPMGLLKSTSEKKQVAIIIVSLMLWGGLWQTGIIGGFVMIVGCATTMIGLYVASLNFGDSLQVFDRGLELRQNGKTAVFAYEEVTSIAAKHTHHHLNNAYVATKAELTFRTEDRFSDLTYQCDYRRNDSKEPLIQMALERCSEAVQLRLLTKLNSDGEVPWTDNIYLTQDGLKIVDSVAAPRIIPFGDIEELKMKDNQLNIWKRGDAMPFMVMSNDATNFVPLLGLFRKLTTVSAETETYGPESAELIEGLEGCAVGHEC